MLNKHVLTMNELNKKSHAQHKVAVCPLWLPVREIGVQTDKPKAQSSSHD